MQKSKFLKDTFYFKFSTLNFRTGQSLVELLLAIGLLSILLPALLTGLVSSREGKPQQQQRLQATALLKEAKEAVRSIREKGWSNLTDGTYHPVISGSSWSLAAGAESTSGFTRQIVVSTAQRNATGNIVDSGGTIDPSTKKIVAGILWNTPISSSVQSTTYLSRYLGNTTWVQTTQSDFNAGTVSNTQVVNNAGGEVELSSAASSTAKYGNRFQVTATSAIGNMDTTSKKTSFHFTAQKSGTVGAIRAYLHSEVGTSPTYRYGLQADVAGLPSGTYLGSGTLQATSTGWKTIALSPAVSITAGTTYHIVVQYNSGTISTSRYIALRQSSPLIPAEETTALYPFSNVADPQVNTLFNSGSSWTVQNFQPIYELDFTGAPSTYEGDPYETFAEVAVYGANFVGEKFRFTDTTKTATNIAFYVRRAGTTTSPLDFVLQDIGTGQTFSCSIPASQISTGFAYRTCTFSPAVTFAQNSDYRIYLKSPNSTSTKNYRLYRINTTNSGNFNSITYDGINSVYTLSSNSGSSWTDSQNSDIGGFKFALQTAGVATSGTFESQTFDCTIPTPPATAICDGGKAGYNYIMMSTNEPANTTTTLKVAMKDSNVSWLDSDFVGPDGTTASSFDNAGGIAVPSTFRYFRFKAYFTGDGITTPTLFDVTLNYSP